MVDTSTFRLTVDGESVPVEDVISAWQNVTQLLTAIERAVVGNNHSPVRLRTEHDPVVEITASVNGVNKEQLDEIFGLAANGLVTGSQSGRYPTEFGADAVQAARNVLRLLRHAESLTVYTDNDGPKVITTANLDEDASQEQIVGLPPRRRVYSSIEGVLRQLTASGRPGYTAAIRDRLSNADVRFSFGHEHLEEIKNLFDKNVVAEGLIVFNGNAPQRFVETPTIRGRARNKPLRSFKGALPGFTDGETAEDFLERLNDGTSPT